MRSERWYWLLGFCGISVCIHLWLVLRSRPFLVPVPGPHTAEIEVMLAAWPDPTTPSRVDLQTASGRDKDHQAGAATDQGKTHQQPAATAVKRNSIGPGGMARLAAERPLPMGMLTGQRNLTAPLLRSGQPTAVPPGGGAAAGRQTSDPTDVTAPETLPSNLIQPGVAGGEIAHVEPAGASAGGHSVLTAPNPLATASKSAVKQAEQADSHSSAKTGIAQPGAGAEGGVQPTEKPQPPATGPVSRIDSSRIDAASRGAGSGREIGQSAGPGTGGAGEGPSGLTRGIPFGDVTGALRGDPRGGGGNGGGPGGPGTGVIIHTVHGLGGGTGGRVHIVYLLDTSGSMAERNKIGKAKQALCKAIAELDQFDTFDVINFDNQIHYFASELVQATLPNMMNARNYVDSLPLNDKTLLSGALEAALALQGVTHIFVLSDGEPNGGIEDFSALLAMVRERNRRRVQINTLALGLGEKFKGMALLKALAEENHGVYSYINLAH
jgi:hypothetical protein